MNNPQIETIARLVILDKEKILLCKQKGKDYYFLPGGHIEFGETAEDAIKREFIEETDKELLNELRFIGIAENLFIQNGKKHHEYNIIFSTVLENKSIVSQEKHIEFQWINITKLDNTKLLPYGLTEYIITWLDDGVSFYINQRNENNQN